MSKNKSAKSSMEGYLKQISVGIFETLSLINNLNIDNVLNIDGWFAIEKEDDFMICYDNKEIHYQVKNKLEDFTSIHASNYIAEKKENVEQIFCVKNSTSFDTKFKAEMSIFSKFEKESTKKRCKNCTKKDNEENKNCSIKYVMDDNLYCVTHIKKLPKYQKIYEDEYKLLENDKENKNYINRIQLKIIHNTEDSIRNDTHTLIEKINKTKLTKAQTNNIYCRLYTNCCTSVLTEDKDTTKLFFSDIKKLIQNPDIPSLNTIEDYIKFVKELEEKFEINDICEILDNIYNFSDLNIELCYIQIYKNHKSRSPIYLEKVFCYLTPIFLSQSNNIEDKKRAMKILNNMVSGNHKINLAKDYIENTKDKKDK
jgi:hypothetical protein